ncbi:MAG: hypothetical protein FWD67_00390 [Betaproteobacteria bacterium]|nr:hypothetical protein [Betaproteobacteria bacterium]
MDTPSTHRRLLPIFALAMACQVLALERDIAAPSSLKPKFRQAPIAFDGRVFFSAAERRALEIKSATPIVTAPPPVATLPKRRFNGTLWRDSRIVALWFDGDLVDPATEPAIRIGDGIPVTMVSGRRQTLSPGQSWPISSRKPEP